MILTIIEATYFMKYLKGEMSFCSGIDSTIDSSNIITNLDCFDYGGDWINKDWNFDDFSASI